MADYTPVFLPGTTVTLTAGGTITGGDLLVVSGVNTVTKAAAVAANYVGVAGHDAVVNGKVTVILAKAVHESVADGAITAGDQLTTTATASRQVAKLAAAAGAVAADINNARSVIGVALTTAADNATVRWVQR